MQFMMQEHVPETTKKPKLNFRFLLSGAWIGGFVFCIIFAVATVFLGEWQMDRRMEKVHEINAIVSNYDNDPVSHGEARNLSAEVDDAQKSITVSVQPQSLEEATLIARNRPRAGVPGFEVLVPLETESGDRLLVERGWLPL